MNKDLVDHATYELSLLGIDKPFVEQTLVVIKALDDLLDNPELDVSADVMLARIRSLMEFSNLTPITSNPDEWTKIAPNLWQSIRNPTIFSNDGGKRYFTLNLDNVETIRSNDYSKSEDPTAKESVTNGDD